ncbi:MAG: hypothetical protein VW338_08275 [Rhodospirillaceae bacterium]
MRMYRAVPTLTDGDAHLTDAKQVIPYDNDSMVTARRNAAVLAAAGEDLAVAYAAGREVFVLLPVNANAMATKESATCMVECLRKLPPICAKAAVLHIFDLPARLTLDVLDNAIIPLLFIIDKFVIEPPLGLGDYTNIATCNAHGVVYDMDEADHDQAGLKSVWARAAPRRLAIFVQNATDEATLAQAERYECRGIDGALFGELLDEIGPRVTATDLGRPARR